MAGYTVGIASETKAFKQGIESGVIQPVEEAEKALDALGRAKGPEQLERGMKDAQKATERLSDETKDTARDIEREFRDSYRKLGNDADDAFDKAKRGAEEFKDEARSTSREAAASFREPADAIDAIQETAANAFAGFGPAGAAAGIAAAIGIGVVGEALTTQQEQVDELKQRFAEAYQSAAEEGRTFLDEAQIQAAAIDILFDPAKRKDAAEEAQRIGVDTLTLIRAQAGDQDALNAVIDLTTKKEAERRDAILDAQGVQGNRLAIADQELNKLEQIRAKYEEQLGIQKDNEQAAADVITLQEDGAARLAEQNAAAKRAVDERGVALQAYADKAASIPNPVLVPTIDPRAAEDEISRFIARRRTPIELSIFYKDPRGVFNP